MVHEVIGITFARRRVNSGDQAEVKVLHELTRPVEVRFTCSEGFTVQPANLAFQPTGGASSTRAVTLVVRRGTAVVRWCTVYAAVPGQIGRADTVIEVT